MAKRSITFYQVGNGNCCLMKLENDVNLVFDLHGTEDKSSFDLITPELPERDGKTTLDVLCVSHGDGDHCQGFRDFKNAIDNDELVIGSIWHSDHDRRENEDKKDLPDDYLALQDEIDRRKEIDTPAFGDIEVALKNSSNESDAFVGMNTPGEFTLLTLHPYEDDTAEEGDGTDQEKQEDVDVNETGLVLRVNVSDLTLLLPGDSGCESWQERIIPNTLEKDGSRDWAQAQILVVSHHGSFGFFGGDREEVRDADPQPDNYEALDYIDPQELVISAVSRLPTKGDACGDDPPHYAAWKWYHKWFRDNHNVGEDDKHPSQFHYTADGHLRLEHGDDGWTWIDDWSPDDSDGDDDEDQDQGSSGKGAAAVRFKHRAGETKRGRDHFA